MPLYDAVKDLTLTVERVELEPHELPLKHFTRRTTVVHLHGGGRRGRRRGRQLRGGAAARLHRRLAPRPDRRAHARLVLGARRRPAGLPAVGARVGGARPRAAAGGALARRRRSAASRSRSASSSRRARSGSCSPSTPRSASSSTRATRGRTSRRRARRDRRRRRRRPEGAVRRRLARRDAFRRALRPRRRGLPGRVARGRPPERRDAAGARAASPTAHVGLPDPLGRRRRGAAVPAATA